MQNATRRRFPPKINDCFYERAAESSSFFFCNVYLLVVNLSFPSKLLDQGFSNILHDPPLIAKNNCYLSLN